MGDHVINHLGELLEMKNLTIRREAVQVFGTYSITEKKVVEVLSAHLESPSWDARVSASEALAAVLKSIPERVQSKEPYTPTKLNTVDIAHIIKTYKPLLSACSDEFDSSSVKLTSKQQRHLIDAHLHLQTNTGLSSSLFLSDAEVLPDQSSSSYSDEDRSELKGDINVTEADKSDDEVQKAIVELVLAELGKVVDVRWQIRHGAALAIIKIISIAHQWLCPSLIEECSIRLLQVLSLDKFNDFVSGRSATAPVRETVSQGVALIIRFAHPSIVELLLTHIQTLLAMKGEKFWMCRQSALLVMKYYFAISEHTPIFESFFQAVVEKLDDDVDDVISASVTALSSLFANSSIGEKKKTFVNRVMEHVWTLLHAETKKDQLTAGLDALVIDLLDMVDTWLRMEEVALSREQTLTVQSTIDPQFCTRSQKAVRILALALDREQFPLLEKEVFELLKMLYRVLLFAPPTDSMGMLEEVYVCGIRLVSSQKEKVQSSDEMQASIGKWVGCLMFDNKSANIDVFGHNVDGPNSNPKDPQEKMCSEEIRFLSDRQKDDLYITRKILAAKYLAAIIQVLYESNRDINGQPLSIALQLMFKNFIVSSSLYQNLGASIVINEWSALFKPAFARNPSLEIPGTVISIVDSYVKSPQKNYDEMASMTANLSADCNEFVDWCIARGARKSELTTTGNAEQISKEAFESCQRQMVYNERNLESLTSRYAHLSELIEFTKLAVKANTSRVFAFFASSLFYFGYVGEKLTPLVRPIVETMNGEANETVAAEVFKGAVPLLVAFSATRQPKPSIKVLARAVEAFSQCAKRIPRPPPANKNDPEREDILSLVEAQAQDSKEAAAPLISFNEKEIASRNALLFLLVCTGFSMDQFPEFYDHFDLDSVSDNNLLLTRLELHRSLWNRVGSQLSNSSTSKILAFIASPVPELRLAGAKAFETFASSQLTDTVNRFYEPLRKMLSNLDSANERRGAIEALLRLSNLGPMLVDISPLVAPLAFARISDPLPEVRETAGLAFRQFLPLLAITKDLGCPAGLSSELWKTCQENSAFVDVLSAPSRLPPVASEGIKGLDKSVQLRHYQLEGITWMSYLRRYSFCGILADDMGLGKTLQTMCAFVLANMDAESKGEKRRPSLVVCPRTLVEHWCAEWKRFFPQHKGDVLQSERATKKQMEKALLVVTSYDELKTSGDSCLRVWWRYVVLDEGHILRNPRTQLFRIVCQLRSETRLILSGTPVQNSSADLWALFAFLIPGMLGDEKYFRATFIKPIQQCRSAKATEAQMKDGQECLGRLHRLVLPFVLRRLKGEVLPELPDKVIQDYECTLTEMQKAIYEMIVDRCCSSPTGQRALSPLHALISLRKVVDHPSLVADLASDLSFSPELLAATRSDDVKLSGKLLALGQILTECRILPSEDDEEIQEIEEDSVSSILRARSSVPHRALIFCQWRASVEIVSNALSHSYAKKVEHLILDGSVPPNQRQAAVDKFNTDSRYDVLVLTTHIGGVGLNLTGADVVIFLDHDWNPMKDLQAIDRAHRLGQTRNVNVYRLITKGTIEEKVMSYQKFKQNTADALIGSENRSLSSMKTDELMSMFALEENSSSSSSGGVARPPTKKRKTDKEIAADPEEKWNLGQIWDESQYEEAHSVENFLKQAK